jgi:ribonuclease HI
MAAKKKFYTVWTGRKPGVYSSWHDCEEQVKGYEGAVYKGFSTELEAQTAFNGNSSDYIARSRGDEPQLIETAIQLTPAIEGICVDGAWNTSTNFIEYQGVELPARKLIFHAGPFSAGTNNIAEFLAIVHALAYCKNKQIGLPIYSDSSTAITWVRKKKAATKIKQDETTEAIRQLVARGELWLKNNDYSNSILKWETKLWGENPADFGRK